MHPVLPIELLLKEHYCIAAKKEELPQKEITMMSADLRLLSVREY